LTMSTVEHHTTRTALALRISQVRVGGMGRNESLRLGRNGCEHALLVEADTVAAAAILRTLKPRATNLSIPCQRHANEHTIVTESQRYLPSPAVATGDSCTLTRGSSLVDDLGGRRRGLLSVDIGTVGTRGRRQTIWVLGRTRDMRISGSHTGRRRILARRRWRILVVCGGRRI